MSKLRDVLSTLGRVQRARWFKIAATAVVTVVAVGFLTTYAIVWRGKATKFAPDIPELNMTPEEAASPAGKLAEEQRTALQATARTMQQILDAKVDPTSTSVTVAVAWALCLVVIWLGLALTYVGIALFAALAWLAMVRGIGWRDLGTLAVAASMLGAAFAALVRGLGILLSARSGPVLAVAKNTLNEAVRGTIGLIFVVLLILLLAGIPLRMDADNELRYRVQAFLSQGTGVAFGVLGLFTVLFTVASITFEQRDRRIWQTMTKPVAAWQYLLGKWLGVVSLNGALLVVCAAGVFLFTEHLRGQKASGESQPYVSADAAAPVTEDRWVLETQVLAARVSKTISIEQLDPQQIQEVIERRLKSLKDANPLFEETRENWLKVRDDVVNEYLITIRAIEPGGYRMYRFTGLQDARRRGVPLTVSYKVQAGSNAPDQIYRVYFEFSDGYPTVRETGLNQTHVLNVPPSVIDSNGVVEFVVYNGDPRSGRGNPLTMVFPPDGLKLSYQAGSYRLNFMRVMSVLWLKLAFLAMIAVCASTFLSFSVASMVAIGSFLAAEATPFLLKSLEYYGSADAKGVQWFIEWFITNVSSAVVGVFRPYADLRPVDRLVSGEILGWGDLGLAGVLLGVMSGVLFVGASLTLRRRELAIYSGH